MGFQMRRWATTGLSVGMHPRPIVMRDSDGTAEPLVREGDFGADVIRFPAGGGVDWHTHAGDHILLVVAGSGCVDVREAGGERRERLAPGEIYLIPGALPHAIRAATVLVLLAVGNRYREPGSPERLERLAGPEVTR